MAVNRFRVDSDPKKVKNFLAKVLTHRNYEHILIKNRTVEIKKRLYL